jgi:hypothetical protein
VFIFAWHTNLGEVSKKRKESKQAWDYKNSDSSVMQEDLIVVFKPKQEFPPNHSQALFALLNCNKLYYFCKLVRIQMLAIL